MPLPYEVRSSITREEARELCELLASDDDFRAQVEKDARGVLTARGIELTAESLPETVTLPPKDKIAATLPLVYDLMGETASPFGFVVLVIVFAAMPLVAGTRPTGDGTG